MAQGEPQVDAAMDRYAAGDDAAFEEVYDELCPRLSRYLQRCLRDSTIVAELLQDTFEHMCRARGSFKKGARVIPWAYAIARNLLIERVRRANRQRAQLGVAVEEDVACSNGSPEQLSQAADLARRLDERLRTLPEPHRVAFELLKLEGLSLEDAADALGTTVTAVKLRHHRARLALKDLVGEDT